jgi:maltose O-acetyltransferase
MLAGEPYDPSDPELVRGRERARALTRRFDETPATDSRARRALLEELLGSIGGRPTIEPPVRCDYGYNIHVGEGFYVNFDCVILDVCLVRFGGDCLLGPAVHVYTTAHPSDAASRREGIEWGEPVTVGANVWIGGRAVLNPGVTVGDDAIVAAGAVVTEDVPANTLVAGNPAQVKRDLS